MTPLRFEAEITPGMAPGQVADLAVEVERAGSDRLGISDVVLWHDCWVLMALCASVTERLEFGPLVTNPYSRHPAVLAGAVATLAERFAVAGTPAECVSQMRRVAALGFDSCCLNLAAVLRPTMYDGLAETIDGAARVLGESGSG